MRRLLIFFVVMLLGAANLNAQKVAIKTNVAADALLNISLGAEFGLAPRWTLDVSGSFNAWDLNAQGQFGENYLEYQKKWKHWYLQPEARFWFCDRFAGHFLGIHVHGGQYNVGGFNLKANFLGTDWSRVAKRRFQGWFGGAGIGYGYAWVLGEHWNLEAELGAGWSYTRYDEFRCAGCGKLIAEDIPHNYFGITKLAINIVYLF